jgi:hypothetical protein
MLAEAAKVVAKAKIVLVLLSDGRSPGLVGIVGKAI